MRMKMGLSLVLGISLTALAVADDVVRIPFVTPNSVYELPQAGVSVWQDFGTCAIARVTADGLKNLEALSYRPEVLDEAKREGAYYVAYLGRPEGKQILDRWAQVLCVEGDAYLIWVQDPDRFVMDKGPLMLARIGMHPLVLVKPPTVPRAFAVPANPFVQDMVNSVRVDSVMAALRRLQNYRNRSSSHDSCRAAVTWTCDKYRAYRNRIPQDTAMLQTWSTTYAPNAILERPGYNHPESICVIGGHIDDASNPGADDNATGTVAAIEAARVMKPYLFERTVRFCAFTGEEQGLLGSDSLAGLYRQRGDNIVGMLNYDMIGHVNPSPESLEIFGRSGGNDAWLMNFVKSAADTYVTSPPLLVNPQNSTLSGSDHASFWAQGYTATCGIEDYPLQNPAYHTQADSIGTGPNVGVNDSLWFVNVVRSAVAAIALLAQPLAPYAQFRLQGEAADTVAPNTVTVDSVTVSSMGSFISPVTMTLDSIRPAEPTITIAFAPNPVTPPPNGSVKTGMRITTTSGTPQQNYMLYYHGTGDTITRRATMALWVTMPTFVIQSTPRTQTIFLGDSTNYADTVVSISGYNSPCTLSATVSPPAPSITVSFLPNNVVIPTDGRWMRVKTTGQTTPGTYVVTAQARNGGTVRTVADTLIVRYPVQGPDPYGYYAYDNTDAIFENSPTYAWIELNPSRGGNGTTVGISGDDMSLRKLFGIRARHYGFHGDSASICTNGWLAVGRTLLQVYSNAALPSASFVPGGVAGIWDDLTISGTGTCWYRVDANQRFIAEWDSVPTLGGTYAGTFEIIVMDTSLTPSTANTRDSEILLQWKSVGTIASATVGQQNQAMSVGLNCFNNGTYDPMMAPITAGRATKFTTDPPRLKNAVELGPVFSNLPMRFALGPAVPNPSRGNVGISYDLPVETQVSLKVYNLSGQLVRSLVSGKEKAGYKHVSWDGRSENGSRTSSGVYFYRLEAGSFAGTRKLVVVR